MTKIEKLKNDLLLDLGSREGLSASDKGSIWVSEMNQPLLSISLNEHQGDHIVWIVFDNALEKFTLDIPFENDSADDILSNLDNLVSRARAKQ